MLWVLKRTISLRKTFLLMDTEVIKILCKKSLPIWTNDYCMGRDVRIPVFGISKKKDSNQPTQLQRLARKLKFR